ncbi:MAG: ATP-binding cassette domain-containing protein [Hyphomicrobium sp.]
MIEFDASLQRNGFVLDASFSAGPGITALFGPSGSGKSTVLGLIGGLMRPSRGRITAGGTVLVDVEKGIFVPRHKRRIGLVFQDALLFPHMTVQQNLKFGRWFAPQDARRAASDAIIEVMGIGHLMQRRPPGLSGGEQQRVALARALLAGPELLLLDEPLSSLDTPRQNEIMALIERTRDEFAIPILYVTHALPEVERLASHVVELSSGRAVWSGTPSGLRSRLRAENR